MREYIRSATVEELKALAHPVRIRILRMCYERALTNQELAERLDLPPGTVLRHVRTLLATDLLVADEPRTGPRGVVERPYRATGLTWQISLEAGGPELSRRVELAALDAYRAELFAAGPHATIGRGRTPLRLTPDTQRELARRMEALVDEFRARDDPEGDEVSLLWSVHRM